MRGEVLVKFPASDNTERVLSLQVGLLDPHSLGRPGLGRALPLPEHHRLHERHGGHHGGDHDGATLGGLLPVHRGLQHQPGRAVRTVSI